MKNYSERLDKLQYQRFFLALILIYISLFLTSCEKKEYESNALLLQKSITLAESGEWAKSHLLASKAVAQDSSDPNARIMFALTLEQLDQIEKAIEESSQAISLDPNNFMAQYTQGRLFFNQRRYEDCPAPLKKAHELNPENSQPIVLLARTNAYLGIRKEAIKYYIALAKHVDYTDKPEPYNELGVLFMNKGDLKRALRFFDEAYSKDKKSIPVNINLAVFWDKLSTMCGDDANRAKKAAKSAIHFYATSEKMLLMNPKTLEKRSGILKRIKELKALR
jgi:tetratricopeptide (TPR) repeat protein